MGAHPPGGASSFEAAVAVPEKHGVGFILRHLCEGVDACGNKYEEQAGYADGTYQACIP